MKRIAQQTCSFWVADSLLSIGNRKLAQGQREIETAVRAAKKDPRRFTAEQSVRMAEEMLKRELRPEDVARLIARNIDEMGAAR